MHTFPHALTHATRTAELAAEAAAWRLAREAAPAAPALPVLPALRNRLGEALIATGTRLARPAHHAVA
ncbi:hypothetical protein [Streptomyces sp. NPDC047976]|uniref:hypothetical protein n=1 Tax=Streptomyces sp. NPDC047976 TaxID=3155746 RepID=UPI00341CA3EA